MMRFFLCVTLIATALQVAAGAEAESSVQYLYLASTEGKAVTTYRLDADTGTLTQVAELSLPGNGGAMCWSVTNNRILYAALTGMEGGKAGVATLQRGAGGQLKVIGTANITSRTPYIQASHDGKVLMAAHYGAGEVTTYRISKGICTSELLDQKRTEKTAHCIELDPSGRFAFVPHTSPNKVYQFRLDTQSGQLTPNDPPFVEGPDLDHRYDEPRHIGFHPKLPTIAYTSNERGGGISRWQLDPKQGVLQLKNTLCTLPPDYDEQQRSAAADLQITPNGKFAYVSNRDTNKREEGADHKDTIAAVALNEKGKMKIVGHYPTCQFPRTMCIDRTGQFLVAAGQRSHTMVVYRIDQQSGALRQLHQYPTRRVPIWATTAYGLD